MVTRLYKWIQIEGNFVQYGRIRGGGGENKMKIPRFSKRRESKAGTCVRSMRLDTHPSRLTRGRVKVKQGRTPRKGLAET